MSETAVLEVLAVCCVILAVGMIALPILYLRSSEKEWAEHRKREADAWRRG